MVDGILTPAVVETAVNAVSTLITQLFQHLDKPAEERRLLDIQEIHRQLIMLGADIDAVVARIQKESQP